jgi:hypothetical protein
MFTIAVGLRITHEQLGKTAAKTTNIAPILNCVAPF